MKWNFSVLPCDFLRSAKGSFLIQFCFRGIFARNVQKTCVFSTKEQHLVHFSNNFLSFFQEFCISAITKHWQWDKKINWFISKNFKLQKKFIDIFCSSKRALMIHSMNSAWNSFAWQLGPKNCRFLKDGAPCIRWVVALWRQIQIMIFFRISRHNVCQIYTLFDMNFTNMVACLYDALQYFLF